uniref:Ig-like domain-containing protein n=1 Tax=Cloacibacillus porcorum TaxID=1197717 RepID=UPI0022E7A998
LLSLTLILNTARPAAALTSADVVYYGSYPQSGTSPDFNEEPVLWRVLEVSGDKTALMLSEKLLDSGVPFNPDYSNTDPYYCWWSESEIRKFLNGKEYVESVSADVTKITVRNPKPYSFYEKAFSVGEGGGIIKADVDNSSAWGAPTGPKTTDKIFLLSLSDVDSSDPSSEPLAKGRKYGFVDDNSRKAELTDYALSQGAEIEGNNKYGYWWLRSLHSAGGIGNVPLHFMAMDILPDGMINSFHHFMMVFGLRPAFRLNLKNIIFTSPAAGGKQDGLTASLHKQTYASNDKGKYEHKLTLATNTYKLASADLTSGDFSISNGAVNLDVKVRYSGASTGVGYHLAAAVTSGDRALYYGRIKSLAAAADKSGDVTFTIPEYKSGEEFYLFVEGRNNNGDNKTDFASKPICLIGPGRKITPLSEDVEEPAPKTTAIEVTPSALTIVKGYATQLSVIFAPEGTSEKIIWSSDKPDIAAVDSSTGVVKALGAGTAVITASTPGGKTSSCAVTVTEKTQAEGIVLTPASMTMYKGTKEKITVSFNGIAEQPLVWSSSDEKIAKVDGQGNVTTLSEGKCMIKASTADGAASAECAVKVTPDSGGGSGGGSGGCNAGLGLGALALLTLLPCAVRKNKGGK